MITEVLQEVRDYPVLTLGPVCVSALGGIVTLARKSKSFASWRASRFVKLPVNLFVLHPIGQVLWPNQRFGTALSSPLVHSTAGVWLLTSQPGSGKSTATRYTLRRLQEMRQIAGACVVDCANIAQVMSEEKVTSLSLALRYQLFRDMSIPRDSRMAPQLSALFKKAANESGRRVVLMLDQFELLRKVATEDELHVMVKGMALDAVQANVHTVLINVADSEFAKKMESWNNNEKIVALESLKDFAWTKEELQAVVNQYRNHDVNLEYMTDEEADAAFAECDTVGKIVTARNRYVENRLPLNLELPKKL